MWLSDAGWFSHGRSFPRRAKRVFPSISSYSRTPSFPTPRLPPFLGSPAFNRYYGGAKTPAFPSAPTRLYLAARTRADVPLWLLLIRGRLTDEVQDIDIRFCPNPVFVLWRIAGLPCFMVSLLVVCPARRPPHAFGPRSYRSSGFAPVFGTTKALRYLLFFRGSVTRLSTSLSTLHAALTNDYARLAYGATLLAFRRDSDPLGRRCDVSHPFHSFPALGLFLCLSVSFICFLGFWFLVSGFGGVPRRHALHGAIQIT